MISNDLQTILKTMKHAHTKDGAVDVHVRQSRLIRAMNLIKENYSALVSAMSSDFGNRSSYQALVADIATSLKMLQHAHNHVAEWMKPEHIENLENGIEARIESQPLGVVGVISPWNFPINLAFGPLAGIFAAGNTAMLKPSELTPETSQLLAELVPHYFEPTELTVVLGDSDVGQQFSALPFDHLVFTGSTTVGKHVMKAAAENLVPVTLELGGKSPVVIDEDFDIEKAVERTLTIKTFNAGQICLSPDYVMLPDNKVDQFLSAAQRFVSRSFTEIQNNPEYTSIISDKHFDRLVYLLKDAESKGAKIINLGPDEEPAYDKSTRKIAPHLVLDVNQDMQIMREEIFGPLLPIKTFADINEALNFINSHDRPLAAYYFSNDKQKQNIFAQTTTSGALVINDVMTHASIEELPFGGVGASGIGAYHGIHGFRRFTHAKPIVIQSEEGLSNLRLRAPYSDKLAAIESFLNN